MQIWPEYNMYDHVYKYSASIREGQFEKGKVSGGFGRIINDNGYWRVGNMSESELHGYGRRFNPDEATYDINNHPKDQLGLFVYGQYQPNCYYDPS